MHINPLLKEKGMGLGIILENKILTPCTEYA